MTGRRLGLLAVPLLATALLVRGAEPSNMGQASPRVIYVDASANGDNDGSSWVDGFIDLQDGLHEAVAGDEIWVAHGIYTPTVGAGRSATFRLHDGVALYGGFSGSETSIGQRDWTAHLTILSGDLDGDDVVDSRGVVTEAANIRGDNSYHVLDASGVSGAAVLDGFIVTSGCADGSLPHDRGGGLYSFQGHPTLRNLEFSGNTAATGRGGGAYLELSNPLLQGVTFTGNRKAGMLTLNGRPTLVEVSFVRNSGGGLQDIEGFGTMLIGGLFLENAGGGLTSYHSTTVLTDVTFVRNSHDYGGGLHASSSSVRLSGVEFISNTATYGGGLYVEDNSLAVLDGVTFLGNSADSWGGGMYSEITVTAAPVLRNCVFVGNSAARGAGLFSFFSAPVLNSTSLSGNSAVVSGGAVGNYYADPDLTNCILWGNAPDQVHNYASSPAISHTLVEGGCPTGAICNGLVITAPAFVRSPYDGGEGWGGGNDDYGDLRLRSSSPAIDAGTPADAPNVDIRGLPRPGGAGYDLGAYEYHPVPVTKEASDARIWAGEGLTYTIRVTNTDSVYWRAVLTDVLPASVMPTGILTWVVEVPSGETWEQQLVVTTSVGLVGGITNSVHVSTDGGAVGVHSSTVVVTSTGLILPHTGKVLSFIDTRGATLTLEVGPGTVVEPVVLVYTPLQAPTHPISPSLRLANHAFLLEAYRGGVLVPGYSFRQPVTITLGYLSEEAGVVDEESLLLYRWDSAGEGWVDAANTCSPPAVYDRRLAENRLSVPLCNLSEFALLGQPKVWWTYLPSSFRAWPPVYEVADAPDLCPGHGIETGLPSYSDDFDHPNDNDWYQFDTLAGEVYAIRTNDLERRTDTVLYLYDTNCTTLLAQNDDASADTRASYIGWQALTDGTYHLMVRSYDWRVWGGGTGYRIQVSEEARREGLR